MNPKNSKKSPIHENADANITCDFGDGDISRSRSFLSNTYRRERPRPHARTRQSRGLLKFISRYFLFSYFVSFSYRFQHRIECTSCNSNSFQDLIITFSICCYSLSQIGIVVSLFDDITINLQTIFGQSYIFGH